MQDADPLAAAVPAAVALRPSRGEQIRPAGLLVGEPALRLSIEGSPAAPSPNRTAHPRRNEPDSIVIHEAILDALASRDEDAAEHLTRTHILRALQDSLSADAA